MAKEFLYKLALVILALAGWCRVWYNILMGILLNTVEKFWSLVDRKGSDECWNWLGSMRRERGYFSLYGLSREVHIIAYELTFGSARGYLVHHSCENKKCCNPYHLDKMTRSQHMLYHLRKRGCVDHSSEYALSRQLQSNSPNLSAKSVEELLASTRERDRNRRAREVEKINESMREHRV